MTNFLPRLITGVVYISLVSGSIIYSSRSFTFLFFILTLLATYESHLLWNKIRLSNPNYNYPIPQVYVVLSMATLMLVPFYFSESYKL